MILMMVFGLVAENRDGSGGLVGGNAVVGGWVCCRVRNLISRLREEPKKGPNRVGGPIRGRVCKAGDVVTGNAEQRQRPPPFLFLLL